MDDRLKRVQKLLDAAEADLHTARSLMRDVMELGDNVVIDIKGKAQDLAVLEEGKIVEGVFNGQEMMGADNKEYQVPANYASKSKLIEGDTLKLSIGDDGGFMFKQIAPMERRKIIGVLSQSDGAYTVNAEGKNYKVLQASITYYKGEAGDQVSIIIPKGPLLSRTTHTKSEDNFNFLKIMLAKLIKNFSKTKISFILNKKNRFTLGKKMRSSQNT
jgi:hypothetical protein